MDRRPKGRYEISIKLQLANYDQDHLEKFKRFLNSTHPIKNYKEKSFGKEKIASRIMFSNLHMGKILMEEFGLIPHRDTIDKLVSQIPESLIRHFIRGIYDAEGSTVFYYNANCLKAHCSFTTLKVLILWIQNHLLKESIVLSKTKLDKRHKNRDTTDSRLIISGTRQSVHFLKWLYKDASVFMNRKHLKFLELKEKLGE